MNLGRQKVLAPHPTNAKSAFVEWGIRKFRRRNLGPQLFQPRALVGGAGKDALHAKIALQAEQRVAQGVVGELVRLGANHHDRTLPAPQRDLQLHVTVLRGNVGVHQADAQRQSFAVFKIRLNKRRPLGGN